MDAPTGGMRRRLVPMAMVVALLGIVAAGLSRLTFDVQILKMLPERMEEVRGLGLLLKHFGLPNEVIITLDCPDPDSAERLSWSLAETLLAEPGLAARAVAAPPLESDPDKAAELIAYAIANANAEKFAAVSDRLSLENAPRIARESFEQISSSPWIDEALLGSYDPFGILGALFGEMPPMLADRSDFVSADGKFRVVYVQGPQEAFGSYKETGVWLVKLRAAVDAWRAREGIANLPVGITGEPVFVAEISSGMERDMKASGIGSLLLVSLVFWLFYRRLRPLGLLVLTLCGCFVTSLAIAGLCLGSLTVIGVGFGAILIGLSVDYGLLVYHLRRTEGLELGALRSRTMRSIGWASATTAGGFLSLAFGDFPALAQLGVLVAVGALVGALLMLGPFAAWICRKPDAAGGSSPLPREWPTEVVPLFRPRGSLYKLA